MKREVFSIRESSFASAEWRHRDQHRARRSCRPGCSDEGSAAQAASLRTRCHRPVGTSSGRASPTYPIRERSLRLTSPAATCSVRHEIAEVVMDDLQSFFRGNGVENRVTTAMLDSNDVDMKISFSTLACPDWTLAADHRHRVTSAGYDGIELRFIENEDSLWKLPAFSRNGNWSTPSGICPMKDW